MVLNMHGGFLRSACEHQAFRLASKRLSATVADRYTVLAVIRNQTGAAMNGFFKFQYVVSQVLNT